MRQDANGIRKKNTYYLLRVADDCCTKEHEEKLTGVVKKKIRNVGSKARKQENRTHGVHLNKASRPCYKAEPGTLSHYLPISSCSRR